MLEILLTTITSDAIYLLQGSHPPLLAPALQSKGLSKSFAHLCFIAVLESEPCLSILRLL